MEPQTHSIQGDRRRLQNRSIREFQGHAGRAGEESRADGQTEETVRRHGGVTADPGTTRMNLFHRLLPCGPARVRQIYPTFSLDNADGLPRSWSRKSLRGKGMRCAKPDCQAGIYCESAVLYGPA